MLTFRFERKATSYAEALRAVGVEPLLLGADDSQASLGEAAGLVLSGGADVDPSLYGQERDPRCGEIDQGRDAFELRLLQDVLAAGRPVLAICRGMQLFNVCHASGTLHQHIEGHEFRNQDPADSAHEVFLEPGTHVAAIFGGDTVPVNSRHHQAVDLLGSGLVVAARASTDGVIEAVERPDLPFAVAVQWHPEDQIKRFPEQLRLFEAFAEALRAH